MKTILYNPIFINPQAYYVFPRLTRYLQPDNESTSEPANYIGTIEVKVIAYGDTTLKRTYTNTDSIDLSEFKNTWIRISLFTKVGSCVLGEWKIGNMESDLPYIDPEVLASLKAVVIVGNKTNNDSDRAIVKNLVDASNPFVISNAAFKLNSGFGGFVEDFTSWNRIDSSTAEISNDGSKIKCINTTLNVQYLFNSINRDIPSFKVKISNFTKGDITYYYRKEDGIEAFLKINPLSVVNSDKVIELPKSYNTVENGTGSRGGFYSSNINIGVTITQIPSFEGAFVTDGIDDLITSTKTASEMGITNEVTVISMIHQTGLACRTNFICDKGSYWRCNEVANTGEGKTGIYGYTSTNNSINIINNILGDKNDYSAVGDKNDITPSQFSVVGYIGGSTGEISYTSSVAWFWTIIANKVLTTDQINQVIAYFNLDKTLKPDILCNTIKQGITNENHAEFGDKLIDFSGNGRDIQLNNIGWKGDSGIGKYEVDFLDWVINSPFINERTSFTFSSSNDTNNDIITIYQRVPAATQSFKIKAKLRGRVLYRYYVNNGDTISISYYEVKEGINILPDSADPTSVNGKVGFVLKGLSSVKVEQVPFHAGALCLDGVNDFGKVTGMPIYKDYTFIIDYERISYASSERWVAGVVSKSHVANQGAFILMTANTEVEPGKQAYSFGGVTSFNRDDFTRALLYQSKYKCGDVDLTVGEGVDSDTLWLGTFRGNDQRFFNGAIYSLMSFPYSMSEFLIERQLKKHKLGTLYPNMVEFRPVIKSNTSYDNIVFYYKNEKVENGTYLTVGSSIGMHIRLSSSPVNEIKSITVNGIPATFKFHDANNNIYQYDFNLTSKSPQKIDITIDEYIRYEDIVQPYPLLFEFTDENGNLISWGGKAKVGNTITRTKSVSNANILAGLYNTSNYKLNGKPLEGNSYVVEKSMIFTCTATYLLDDNEPKCILSPSRLRMPNSSYKLLGYIPDISGHGNHGVIHNSAYAEGSGVNEDGSYQLDGVDDFVTIPTVAGKQVLMKLNWQNEAPGNLIYDQRDNGSTTSFAIMPVNINDSTNNKIAYQARNANGITYIDGIRNEYIESYSLENIIHNITITNPDVSNKTVALGASNRSTADYFAKYALYDFMLFDDISTDDKIKELNEYVGIEAKVELPPYYWDTYGKTNLDADKATIQQRGVAVGDYDLTNTNFAYDKMSGFGGYEFEKFTDTTKWIETKREDGIEVIEKNDYSFTAKKVGTGQYFWDFKNNSIKTLDRDLTVKAISNNNVYIRWEFKYRTAEKPDIDSAIILLRQAMTPDVPITVTLPYKTQEEQTELGVVEGSAYYLFYFDPSDIPVGDEYTVEMLPLYTNGLVYDGITDYSKNANIPALDDFTAIIKREWLKKQGCPLIKGSKVYEGGNGNALLLEWDKAYNFVFYKRTDIMEGELPDNISFITPTNYNGNVITRGSEQDTNGICIAGDGNAGFANMVFYKLILYPKTIPLLQINFLKNLMERDEIIDLNNPIFIQE